MNRPWSLARTPAFWIMLVPVALTSLAVLLFGVLQLFVVPRSTALAVPLSLAYGALWIVVLLRVADIVERRPAGLVALAVAWGGTVACAVGIVGGVFLDHTLGQAISPSFAAHWGAAFVAPTVEEAGKAAGVVLLLLAARPYLTTVWSAAGYGALVGVGFAVVEDAAYAVLYADMALPDDVSMAARVLALRFVVPGLFGHPLFSAVAGAGIGYAWLRADRTRGRRLAVLAGALGVAWLIHFMVNSPLASGAASVAEEIGAAGGWAGYFAVIGAAALPGVWWLSRVRRADAEVLLVRAAAIAPAVMTPDDVATLAGWRSRRRAGRLIRKRYGPAAAAAARRLRRAQVRLAAALARPYRGWVAAAPPYWYAPPVLRWWQEGYEARQQLAAAGGPAVDRLSAAGSAIGGGRADDPVAAGAMAVVSGSAGSAGSGAAATVASAGSAASGAAVTAAGSGEFTDVGPGAVGTPAVGSGVAAQPGGGLPRPLWTAAVLLAAALAGLVFWPLAAVAAAGALLVIWHGRGPTAGRLLPVAGLTAAFGGYVWLVSALVAVCFPG